MPPSTSPPPPSSPPPPPGPLHLLVITTAALANLMVFGFVSLLGPFYPPYASKPPLNASSFSIGLVSKKRKIDTYAHIHIHTPSLSHTHIYIHIYIDTPFTYLATSTHTHTHIHSHIYVGLLPLPPRSNLHCPLCCLLRTSMGPSVCVCVWLTPPVTQHVVVCLGETHCGAFGGKGYARCVSVCVCVFMCVDIWMCMLFMLYSDLFIHIHIHIYTCKARRERV